MTGSPSSSTPASPASIGSRPGSGNRSRRASSSATGTGGSPASRSRSGASPATSGSRGRHGLLGHCQLTRLSRGNEEGRRERREGDDKPHHEDASDGVR